MNIFNPAKSLKAGDIQSLVVLPFENFTGDDQLENMVAGMHSILVGDLMRLSGLRVKGRTTSKLYKDTELSAQDIAKELNVEAILEASVILKGDGHHEAVLENLEHALAIDPDHSFTRGQLSRAERFSEAIDKLEEGNITHNPNMPYIGTGTRFEALHDSARFLAILNGMNLPHPKKQ